MMNGASLWLPLSEDVKRALEVLPVPHGAQVDCRYYFWGGIASRDEYIKTVCRTLKAVFRKSGLKGASSHRFRHTLATEILVNGGSIEDAANPR
jgi:integrase